MGDSKVCFTDLRTSPKENLLDKVVRLLDTIDLGNIVPRRSLLAIKLHFGEKGNLAFIRPTILRRIVDYAKEMETFPFLTDTNTLYGGTRGHSVSHLTTAVENGFAYSVINAPIVIADGMRGGSSTAVQINQKHIKWAYIGREIAESDALMSVAHFKGHELSGFGGTLKNLGMGCASRKGKMAQHADLSPKVKRKKCIGCGECVEHCAQTAISMKEKKANIDAEKCIGCAECILICENEAIDVRWNADIPKFQEKMVEYVKAVLKGKEKRCVFMNFLTHISPACDCYGHNDAPIVRDLGIMISKDPVAIDQASADMVNAQPGLEGTCLESNRGSGEDKFRGLYPKVDWTIQLHYGEKLGLGKRGYELITI
jgi:uncharacterized Fe-S center protein